jgi:hypothetical protein
LFLDIVDGGVMICEDDRAEDEESESKDRWTRRSRSGEGTRDDDSETDSEARRRYEEEKRGEKNGVVGNSSGDVKGRKEEFWVGNASVCWLKEEGGRNGGGDEEEEGRKRRGGRLTGVFWWRRWGGSVEREGEGGIMGGAYCPVDHCRPLQAVT